LRRLECDSLITISRRTGTGLLQRLAASANTTVHGFGHSSFAQPLLGSQAVKR
jgi:hypothetical protein